MLPEHVYGFNLTNPPLIHVCPWQPWNKRSGEPISIHTSRSQSIQGLETNQWPTRTTVLAQSWSGATQSDRSTWAMSTTAFPGNNVRSLSYGAVAFNWRRPGAALVVRNVKTWAKEAWTDLRMVGHGVMPHGGDGDQSWGKIRILGLRWMVWGEEWCSGRVTRGRNREGTQFIEVGYGCFEFWMEMNLQWWRGESPELIYRGAQWGKNSGQ
jgi:hypothetical protein